MSVSEIIGAAVGLIREIQAAKLPVSISQQFGPGSPRAGVWAADLVLTRDPNGAIKYQRHEINPVPQRAELEEHHAVYDLESLRLVCSASEGCSPSARSRTLFVGRYDNGVIVSAIDTLHPELGTISARLLPSPAFIRWALFGYGQVVQLTHEHLADALLDGAEDLCEPKDRLPFVSFRGAQTIEYEADFEAGSSRVSVGYQRKGKGAESTALALPRSIRVNLEGVEGVSAVAEFRIRVVPPKGDQKEPTFRVQFANAAEWKSSIEKLIAERAQAMMPSSLVVRGTPDSRRFAG